MMKKKLLSIGTFFGVKSRKGRLAGVLARKLEIGIK
jgi:hypothetical protein